MSYFGVKEDIVLKTMSPEDRIMNGNLAKPIGCMLKKIWVTTIVFLCLQTTFSQKQTIKTSGDVLVFAMPAIAIGSTLIKGDTKGTWQFTKGFLTNFALTAVLKSTINKERPDGTNNHSFPSGHTSIAFQSASFFQKRYGWKYGIPAYILASYTGFSRVYSDKHDVYDVLAGAIIGVGSTYIFTTPYQQEHMELTFNTGDGNYLLGFRYKF
jgi:membrane-associated phospholipid phosphatase